jgi:predicted Zn-dependent protease with MMP-like domain
MENIVVLVEDEPEAARPRKPAPRSLQSGRELVMGVFVGTPTTDRSVFAIPSGPARIVLYQKNIERICHSDAEIRRQVRLTVIHEVGHYFGLDEDQLRHV